MDARVYAHLADSIAAAASTADLADVGGLVVACAMPPRERLALERALRSREAVLRGGDAAADAADARAPE